MQKRFVFLLVLLALFSLPLVFAVEITGGVVVVDSQGFTRDNNVGLENVHQLREENATFGELNKRIEDLQQNLSRIYGQIERIAETSDFVRATGEQFLGEFGKANQELGRITTAIEQMKPAIEEPAALLPISMILMVGFYVLLIVLIVVIVVWVKRMHHISIETPPEVRAFIRQSLDRGVANDDIKHQLLLSGWNPSQIERGIKEVQKEMSHGH